MNTIHCFKVKTRSQDSKTIFVERRLSYTFKGLDVVAIVLRDVPNFSGVVHCSAEQFERWSKKVSRVGKLLDRTRYMLMRKPRADVLAIINESASRHAGNEDGFLDALATRLYDMR